MCECGKLINKNECIVKPVIYSISTKEIGSQFHAFFIQFLALSASIMEKKKVFTRKLEFMNE